nr:ribonuclease H-like domain-containing protein [Tanacetum cinerariifolium]
SSSSSSSDNEVVSCSKACTKAYAQLQSHYDKLNADFQKSQFDVISYQTGLESVKARLLVYQQNKSVFKEDIKLLKLKVQLRDNALVSLRQNLKKVKQERNDLKLKLEKFPTSSKNLSDLLASQTNAKTGNGYHVVPPPYTGTFMPPKPDLTNRPSAPIIEDWVSDSEDESETNAPQNVLSFVQSTKQVKSPRPSIKHVKTSIPAATPKPKMAQPIARNHAHMGNHKQYAQMTFLNPQRHVVPAAVLTQSKLVPINVVPINVVRPVSTIVPKIKVTRPTQYKPIVTKPNSPTIRHINRSPSLMASNSPPRVTSVQAPVGNPQHALKDKGVIDSGCSSVSQMCDKKNSVLFTDTECLVLSPDFKLPDENQLLLRVPREINMYNVNLKNIIPSGDLTCLFAKATFDESNLWHRRLGHINFKTINKLVKDDYSRFTWVFFLATKDETSPILKTFVIVLWDEGIKMEFSVPRTLQQNGIAEKKNRILIEAARTMLADSLLPIPF